MHPSPILAPNKFDEKPSGVFRMQENLLAAWAPHRIPLWEKQRSPRSRIADREWASCPFPIPKNPMHSRCWSLAPLAFAFPVPLLRPENRRLVPSQHDGPDPPMEV